MKKVKGLTKRLAAVLLSGMLVVGAVPGTVLASESPEDMGQTSEISAEGMGDTLSEEVSTEVYAEDPSAGDVGSDIESFYGRGLFFFACFLNGRGVCLC